MEIDKLCGTRGPTIVCSAYRASGAAIVTAAGAAAAATVQRGQQWPQ